METRIARIDAVVLTDGSNRINIQTVGPNGITINTIGPIGPDGSSGAVPYWVSSPLEIANAKTLQELHDAVLHYLQLGFDPSGYCGELIVEGKRAEAQIVFVRLGKATIYWGFYEDVPWQNSY